MYGTEQAAERLILFSVKEQKTNHETKPSETPKMKGSGGWSPAGCGAGPHGLNLSELAMLAKTAGGEIIGEIIQNRERIHPGYYLGKGKIAELKEYAESLGATGILCDDELSSGQIKNLDEAFDFKLKILDRTMIILDIFAERALSSEGKAQVELAQLKYRLSRLTGLGKQLSRQGGHSSAGGLGIGARGPGEKKLETDRRHIQSRIRHLNKELGDIRTGRAVLRERRLQAGIQVISLVGYTNAGKSTLMNALTAADVPAEDKLFATLDTTVRKLRLPGGTKVLVTDTVGFIEKLPHHLIQAFRATLEELKYASILVHVADASNPNLQDQISVVHNTLEALKCLDKPMITAFNKQDIKQGDTPKASSETSKIIAESGTDTPSSFDTSEIFINISAKTGLNLDKLQNICESLLSN